MLDELFKTYKVKLVGCNFANPSKVPEENDIIRIKLEPNNPIDPDAIMILNDRNEKIGYVGTTNTVSAGNRKNGCLDNNEIKEIIDFEKNDSCLGVITKFKGYFGFCDITVYMGE